MLVRRSLIRHLLHGLLDGHACVLLRCRRLIHLLLLMRIVRRRIRDLHVVLVHRVGLQVLRRRLRSHGADGALLISRRGHHCELLPLMRLWPLTGH